MAAKSFELSCVGPESDVSVNGPDLSSACLSETPKESLPVDAVDAVDALSAPSECAEGDATDGSAEAPVDGSGSDSDGADVPQAAAAIGPDNAVILAVCKVRRQIIPRLDILTRYAKDYYGVESHVANWDYGTAPECVLEEGEQVLKDLRKITEYLGIEEDLLEDEGEIPMDENTPSPVTDAGVSMEKAG